MIPPPAHDPSEHEERSSVETTHEDIPGNPSTSISARSGFNDPQSAAELRALSMADWEQFEREGYVVVSDAVPHDQIDRLVELLWEFEEKDPDDPETWYEGEVQEMEMEELTGSGMVEIYNHQYLWDNRQTRRVYEAFADIWGTEELWVSIDRANLNLPARGDFSFDGFIHWDYDPEENPVNVQGVLALNDQLDEQMGGFQCVPELYRTYDEWKKTQPDDRDHFHPDVSGFEIEKVGLEKGDLIIWNSLLPHGIRPNRSDRPRLAQYITMMPAEEENEELRQWRIESWRERKTPPGMAFPGDPRGWEQERYETAELTELGEKLLGLEDW